MTLQELNVLKCNDEIKNSVAIHVEILMIHDNTWGTGEHESLTLNVILCESSCINILIGKLLAKIWYSLGYVNPYKSNIISNITDNDQLIKILNRSDFVDKYVGWTYYKCNKILEENLGKVIFIDDACSLVVDINDSFGIEALTAIDTFLINHPKQIIIFSGYQDSIERGILTFNPGLKHKISWKFG